MKVIIKAVEVTFIDEEVELVDGILSGAIYDFVKAHPRAVIESIDTEWPDGRRDSVDTSDIPSLATNELHFIQAKPRKRIA